MTIPENTFRNSIAVFLIFDNNLLEANLKSFYSSSVHSDEVFRFNRECGIFSNTVASNCLPNTGLLLGDIR